MALIVLLAGLPGVGKSTLAGPLAHALSAEVIDRDQVKEAVIPAGALTHSPAQVDLATRVCAQVCEVVVSEHPDSRLIVDGHTFSRRRDVERYRAIAARYGARLLIVACTADESVVAARIAADGAGLDKERTWAKYVAVRDRFEPLEDAVTVDLTDGVEPAVDGLVRLLHHLDDGDRHG